MKNIQRRSFIKTLGALPLLFTAINCSKNSAATVDEVSLVARQPSTDPSKGTVFPPGYLSILQGPSSDTEALFNLFVPRLKQYTYKVVDSADRSYPIEHYETVTGPGFYHVNKLKASELSLGESYRLQVFDKTTLIDERFFSTLDIHKSNPNFALLSCMCDDYRFNTVIDPMWERLRNENPDFAILNGDTVYVDSFEFVEREKATEYDLWQRYTDAFRRLPIYHWKNLVPIFATWDDHDFGTNDGSRNFIAKEAAARLFHAIFGGKEITGVWEQSPMGVSSKFIAFNQTFYLMDDRSFRQPNKNQTEAEPFGHWGQSQHEWLLENLAAQKKPAWIINGNQCFIGKDLSFKESFEANHPAEFVNFINELKNIPAPVVFASGDIHLSEIMQVPAERIGYETYEFTSSSMHSYTGNGWDNPSRLDGAYTTAYNFMMVRSQNINGAFQIQVRCLGLPESPYFEKNLRVSIV